jgi:RNA polymerase sigma-70 factor (ECF subfamily)
VIPRARRFPMLPSAHATIPFVSRDNPNRSTGTAPPKLRLVDGRTAPAAERVDADDATLASEALAGQRWAQREIWHRFAPMVFGLFRRSLSARHDHEDLLQEVFVRVFRRLHTLENQAALRSFIYSVAVRVMSEEIRHFQVLQRAHTQLALMGEVGGGTDFEARDTLLRIQRILDGMKDKHRAAFVLRHVEGLDLREIADGLGISLATVKRYLVKAMAAIERATLRDDTLKTRLGLGSAGGPTGGRA